MQGNLQEQGGKEMNSKNLEGLVQRGPLVPLPFPLPPVRKRVEDTPLSPQRGSKITVGVGTVSEPVPDTFWDVQYNLCLCCLTNHSSVLRDADDLICWSHFLQMLLQMRRCDVCATLLSDTVVWIFGLEFRS